MMTKTADLFVLVTGLRTWVSSARDYEEAKRQGAQAGMPTRIERWTIRAGEDGKVCDACVQEIRDSYLHEPSLSPHHLKGE